MRHCHRQCGFADAAWPGDGHEAFLRERRSEVLDERQAPDHAGEPCRQACRWLVGGGQDGLWLRGELFILEDRHDEAIATPRHIFNIGGFRVQLRQRFAQHRDLYPQVAVISSRVTPNAAHQIPLGHDLAGIFRQDD